MTSTFFHPDYTVGSGLTPDLLSRLATPLAGSDLSVDTAGGEFHPALKVLPLWYHVARW